jgi:hypothetical protein
MALAGIAGQLTAFVASQNSVVGAPKERVTFAVSAVASLVSRGTEFCGSSVVCFDLWTVEELMNRCDFDWV